MASYTANVSNDLVDGFNKLNEKIVEGFKDVDPSKIVKIKYENNNFKINYLEKESDPTSQIHLKYGADNSKDGSKELGQIEANDMGNIEKFTNLLINFSKKKLDKLEKIDVFHGILLPNHIRYFFEQLKFKKVLKDIVYKATPLQLYFYESVNEWLKESKESCCGADILIDFNGAENIVFLNDSLRSPNITYPYLLHGEKYSGDVYTIYPYNDFLIGYKTIIAVNDTTNQIKGGAMEYQSYSKYAYWILMHTAMFFIKLSNTRTCNPKLDSKTKIMAISKYDIICAMRENPDIFKHYLALFSFLIEGINKSIIYLNEAFDSDASGCTTSNNANYNQLKDVYIGHYYSPKYTKHDILDLCNSTRNITTNIITSRLNTPSHFGDSFAVGFKFPMNPIPFSDYSSFSRMLGGYIKGGAYLYNHKISKVSETLIKILEAHVNALKSRGYKCSGNSYQKIQTKLDELKKSEENFTKELSEYQEKMNLISSTNGYINPDNMSSDMFEELKRKREELNRKSMLIDKLTIKSGKYILDLNDKIILTLGE